MKGNELVWRELIDTAIVRGDRRWPNVADLAFRAGVPASTATYALQRLIEIGAVVPQPSGFYVASPEKVLTCLCGRRSIHADTIARTTVAAFERWRERRGESVTLGGAAAAVVLLGGENTVSDYSTHIYYLDERAAGAAQTELPPGGDVILLSLDRRARKDWDGHSSFAQTYADLFATPGWQATEFRLALHDRFLSGRDWDQEVRRAVDH